MNVVLVQYLDYSSIALFIIFLFFGTACSGAGTPAAAVVFEKLLSGHPPDMDQLALEVAAKMDNSHADRSWRPIDAISGWLDILQRFFVERPLFVVFVLGRLRSLSANEKSQVSQYCGDGDSTQKRIDEFLPRLTCSIVSYYARSSKTTAAEVHISDDNIQKAKDGIVDNFLRYLGFTVSLLRRPLFGASVALKFERMLKDAPILKYDINQLPRNPTTTPFTEFLLQNPKFLTFIFNRMKNLENASPEDAHYLGVYCSAWNKVAKCFVPRVICSVISVYRDEELMQDLQFSNVNHDAGKSNESGGGKASVLDPTSIPLLNMIERNYKNYFLTTNVVDDTSSSNSAFDDTCLDDLKDRAFVVWRGRVIFPF